MRPEFKSSWDRFFHRMTAWWQGTLEGPIVRIPALKGQPQPDPLPDDTDWEAQYADATLALRGQEEALRNEHYLTDTAPSLVVSGGHGLGAYLGCRMEFRRETAWMHPCLNTIQDPLDVTRWHQDPHWQRFKNRLATFSAGAAGRYGVCYYLGGIIQAMALMRGDQPFLMDLLDHPADVDSLRDRLLPEWFSMAEELESLLPKDGGQWTMFGLWAPGRVTFCECDVACNFSPALFRRFVVPEVRAMARWAEYSIYHLDGPGAVKHLDALLEIPEINVIQWIPGTGSTHTLDWLPLLRRIQTGGKCLWVECASCQELEVLLDTLNPKGLFIQLYPWTGPEQVETACRIAAQHGADQSGVIGT
jgi:hypothetical protein